jgi:hypothetical protein
VSTELLTEDIWPQLTSAVRAARQPCSVAVAYLGKGASRLLPLPRGSRLVVDASERAVSSGQTCPADLGRLIKAGVRVYSVPNLHAKVYVVGRAAFIGSANASSRASSHLVEAMVRTTESSVVGAAKDFVLGQCLHELTPEVVKRLTKLYRPPKVAGGGGGKRKFARSSGGASLPRLLLAQLRIVDLSDAEQEIQEAALEVAKKRREHKRGFEIEDFRYYGRCPFRRGDVVVQVTDEGGGKVLVAPPGNVLHVTTRKSGRVRTSFVCVERPVCRRRGVDALARRLGRKGRKLLRRNGLVRNSAFAEALLKAWSR